MNKKLICMGIVSIFLLTSLVSMSTVGMKATGNEDKEATMYCNNVCNGRTITIKGTVEGPTVGGWGVYAKITVKEEYPNATLQNIITYSNGLGTSDYDNPRGEFELTMDIDGGAYLYIDIYNPRYKLYSNVYGESQLVSTLDLGHIKLEKRDPQPENHAPIICGQNVKVKKRWDYMEEYFLYDVEFLLHYYDEDFDIYRYPELFVDGEQRTIHEGIILDRSIHDSDQIYITTYDKERDGNFFGKHEYYLIFDDGYGGVVQTEPATFRITRLTNRDLSANPALKILNLLKNHFLSLQKFVI